MNCQLDRKISRRTDCQPDRKISRRTDCQLDRKISRRTDCQLDRKISRRTDCQLDRRWVNEPVRWMNDVQFPIRIFNFLFFFPGKVICEGILGAQR